MPTSMTQQNIEASKSPGFMPLSIARRNIHTAKYPRLKLPRITRDNGIGLGLTTRCGSHSFLGPRNGNDDDDDGCVRNRFRSDSNGDDDDDGCIRPLLPGPGHHDADDDLDLELDQVDVFG